MINFEDLYDNCTGCGACVYLCPTKSITLKKNNEGFLYVHINADTCVECKKCLRVCHQNLELKNTYKQIAIAALSKNKELRKKSSSGGVFAEAAKHIISNHGLVAGTVYDADFNVVQILTDNLDDIHRMQGSKYVQAESYVVYEKIRQALEKKDKNILYVGTPCQIAGLLSFINGRPSNLFTMDLICHGVPSPQMFKNYIAWKERKLHKKIHSYSFRNKSAFNRTGFISKLYLQRKCISILAEEDPYYNDFLQCKNFRECCYQCKYSARKRVGDISIGDLDNPDVVAPGFWGWEALSTVIINNSHGKELWDQISNLFFAREIDLSEEAKYNHNLSKPSVRPECRNDYYLEMEHGYFFDQRQPLSQKRSLLFQLKRMIPVKIKYCIKKGRLR